MQVYTQVPAGFVSQSGADLIQCKDQENEAGKDVPRLTVQEHTLQALYGEMVKTRRELHRRPELSFREVETSNLIAAQLTAWGYEVRRVAGTGVLASIAGGKPGRTIALRADIDALPIQDDKVNCEYRSQVPGVMHACGHDGHTAELLAVARYYSMHREQIAGTRVFLFQPGEEVIPGGAVGMIEAGALEGVDAIYGVHLWSPMPYGTIGTCAGPFMASPDEFALEISGHGGHGALPHECADALLAGAALTVALQTIVSRNVDPLERAVVTVGQLHAGTANNIIAGKCELNGTIRTFSAAARALIRRRLEEIVRHTCEMYGCSYKLSYDEGYPPVVNDPVEAARLFRVAELFPDIVAVECPPSMVGEDFSYYLQRKPGCFFFVGAGKPGGASPPHHHSSFDIDERAMLHAARLLIAVADDAAAGNR